METKHLDRVVIRFVGDSGDGMQLTGSEFAKAAAEAGNDISTFPDFPAEIRAPAGSLFGVSGFQLHFSSSEIHTPGDAPDVLVAMNPAGLKTNIKDLIEGGTLIVNTGAFIEANLKKAELSASNPLEDGSLDKYKVHAVDINHLTMAALDDSPLSNKEKGRAKNFFALGLVFWMYGRETEGEIRRIHQQFAKKPEFGEANVKVFKAGYHFGETAEVFQTVYKVPAARVQAGHVQEHHGQRGDRARPRGRRRAGRQEAVLLGLPDHARVVDPALARQVQELRHDDVPGRGRDRGDGRGARRGVRRLDRGDRVVAAPASRSRARRLAWAS